MLPKASVSGLLLCLRNNATICEIIMLSISILIYHNCEVDGCLGKGEVLTNTDLDRCFNNI